VVSDPRLERLSGADSLLDQLEQGSLNLSDAYEKLQELERAPGVRLRYARAALLISVTGWVLFLNGVDFITVLVALLASLLTLPVGKLVKRLRLPMATSVFVSTVILAAVPNLLAAAGVGLKVGRPCGGGSAWRAGACDGRQPGRGDARG
jgi:uncharacterized membrane protein YjjP (DUF1212 family)